MRAAPPPPLYIPALSIKYVKSYKTRVVLAKIISIIEIKNPEIETFPVCVTSFASNIIS